MGAVTSAALAAKATGASEMLSSIDSTNFLIDLSSSYFPSLPPVAIHGSRLVERLFFGNPRPILSLQLFRHRLHFAHHAEQVAAENLPAVFRRVAPRHQCGANLRQIGGRINPLRQLSADSVKIRSQANMIHPGHFGDVIDVVDQL